MHYRHNGARIVPYNTKAKGQMSTQRLKDRKILIVDDDEDILSSIDLAMRAEGAATHGVTDGNSAVSMSHSINPDAIILDMMLPLPFVPWPARHVRVHALF